MSSSFPIEHRRRHTKTNVRSSTIHKVFAAVRAGDREKLEELVEDLVTNGQQVKGEEDSVDERDGRRRESDYSSEGGEREAVESHRNLNSGKCTYQQLATLVEIDDKFERYPVHIAAVMGHIDCLSFLLGPIFGAAFASHGAAGTAATRTEEEALPTATPLTPRELNEFFRCGRDGTPLHNAVDAGQYDAVRFLVEELECDPCHVLSEDWGTHCLHFACQGGHLKLVNYFLSEYPATMLHTQEEKAEYWRKMNPKSHNMYVVWSPLHYACASVWKHHRFDDESNRERIEIVRLLVGEPYNCDPHRAERYQGYTLVLAVAERGHVSMLRFLVEELGCDYKVRDARHNADALEIACWLNTAGPKKRKSDGVGGTEESDEKEANHIEIIRYLVHDLEMCPVNGSALPSLVGEDKYRATRMLLGEHSDDEEDEALLVESKDRPVARSAKQCRGQRRPSCHRTSSLPIALLESSIVSADALASLLLMAVSPRMSLFLFKHLVSIRSFYNVFPGLAGIKGTDIDLQILNRGCLFAFPQSYFEILALYSCQEGIDADTERKVDLNLETARDSAGQSILHKLLCQGGHGANGKTVAVIDLLCRNFGCDVNARDATGRTPLHLARNAPVSRSASYVAKLLEWGADVNALCVPTSGAGSSHGNEALVSHLMGLEARRELGFTPLQRIVIPTAGSVYRSDNDATSNLVRLLLDAGADVNAASILHQVCRTAFEQCKPTVVRERWGTPLDLCGSNPSVVELLHAEGAKRISELIPAIYDSVQEGRV